MSETMRRSWLLVPMSKPEQIAHAPQSGADVIVLDLVELVAEEDKFAARKKYRRRSIPFRRAALKFLRRSIRNCSTPIYTPAFGRGSVAFWRHGRWGYGAAPFVANTTSSASDPDRALRQAEAARKCGFRLGGGGLNPAVVEPHNPGLTPSEDDVRDAHWVLEQHRRLAGTGGNVDRD